MAIAWSRISSKVIAHPPYADAAYKRRCRNKTGRSDPCIPHIVDKRKQAVLEAHDAEVMPFSQIPGGMCHGHLGRLRPPKPPRNTGAHHVSHHTIRQKTRQSQTASPPHSAGAPRT